MASQKSVKHLECFYWRQLGHCDFEEHQCLYAHHPTGQVAERPVKRQQGRPAVAGRNANSNNPVYHDWRAARYVSPGERAQHLRVPPHLFTTTSHPAPLRHLPTFPRPGPAPQRPQPQQAPVAPPPMSVASLPPMAATLLPMASANPPMAATPSSAAVIPWIQHTRDVKRQLLYSIEEMHNGVRLFHISEEDNGPGARMMLDAFWEHANVVIGVLDAMAEMLGETVGPMKKE